MTQFECHKCIEEKCPQQGMCDQFARLKAERFKEVMRK